MRARGSTEANGHRARLFIISYVFELARLYDEEYGLPGPAGAPERK